MKKCDVNIQQTLILVEQMLELADKGDFEREDTGCGILYGMLRDSAYKIQQLALKEKKAHMQKGWWRDEKDVPPPAAMMD